jgi:phosphatidylserine decarboxylase
MGPIDGQGTFVVKGRPYSVAELVGGQQEAERFLGGSGCVVYLSPRDYHRVHAPVGGVIRRIRSMPGDYFPVNAIGVKHVANLFCRNRRVAIEIDADPSLGRVTVVMVVAMIVGRITTVGIDARDVPLGDHVFEPALRIGRGDEIGVFHLGSTAVVLTEKRASGAWLVSEGPVRYGQALLRGGSA